MNRNIINSSYLRAVCFIVPEMFPAHLIHNAWPGALHRIFPASVHCSSHRFTTGDAKPQTPRLAENLLQNLLPKSMSSGTDHHGIAHLVPDAFEKWQLESEAALKNASSSEGCDTKAILDVNDE